MNEGCCGRESDVVAAVRGGAWSDELRLHAAGCEECAEAAFVAAHLMAEAEAETDVAPALPDPALLWRRARLEERDANVKRATRAIAVMQFLAASVVAGGASFGLVVLWPLFQSEVSSWLRRLDQVSLGDVAAQPGVLLLVGFLSFVAIFLHERWQDI